MNKGLKKILRITALAMYMASIITACTDTALETDTSKVKVNVIDSYYKPAYSTSEYNVALKIPVLIQHPAKYRVTVQYDIFTYDFTDEESYEKYGDKIGDEVDATLTIRKYSDGTLKYDIISLD